MATSFRHFSASEVEVGLKYAEKELSIRLDRDTLRRLADDTGVRWYNHGRKSGLLLQAKREVLDADLWIRNRCDAERRNAYSRAISKIFSARSHHTPKKPKQKLIKNTKSAAADPNVYGFDAQGRGVFLFPGTP